MWADASLRTAEARRELKGPSGMSASTTLCTVLTLEVRYLGRQVRGSRPGPDSISARPLFRRCLDDRNVVFGEQPTEKFL